MIHGNIQIAGTDFPEGWFAAKPKILGVPRISNAQVQNDPIASGK
jgi:hypothetical protein